MANQYKTTIAITDITNELTLFYACFDYRVLSNYYSQVTPPEIVEQASGKRILHYENEEQNVELSNVQRLGSVYFFYEMENATNRNARLKDQWFVEKGYLKSYTVNQHDQAISDIVNIINSNLLWDLEELWIIDPYMCAEDIVKTAFQCSKRGIVIKVLNSYGVIHKNKETKDSMSASDFLTYKEVQSTKLSIVLGEETDLKIEYRTTRNGKDLSFHDRYIILKYNINNDRVWSLGASINSIGKTRSIIQIVESPGTILKLFDDLWNATNSDECRIFSNS
ncbi:VPA1262 family N-terminal domain-containing protein [Ohessyouella blattaphilus]|uniref:VPA1262 family N-terminal domain-containing protein n=1 Tax=Ohessyouella blattaphilus TaxID=2949333 RepID=A0ABT1EL58_9FIRM|nr:VPA1262 family N-terminal domain-containing protein [Ohessyouella blattaphilus]MCP1111444.1 VPA1262 family N-terminal domain-containing protein [Ohessyouella blattaphilus]MCR8564838.1 VPA1262 family N-terminal domain-containing protein [Ohessyouella blattaphilus]